MLILRYPKFLTIFSLITTTSFAWVNPHYQSVKEFPPFEGQVSVYDNNPPDGYAYDIVGYMSDCSGTSDRSNFIEKYSSEAAKHGANAIVITKAYNTNPSYAVYGNRINQESSYCISATAIRIAGEKPRQLPPNAAYNQIGGSFYENHQYKQAIDFFSKAIEKDPSCAECWYNRGISFLAMGDTSSGITDIQAAAALKLQVAVTLLLKLRFLENVNRTQHLSSNKPTNTAPRQDANSQISTNDSTATTYNKMGYNLAFKEKNYNEAIRCFSKSILETLNFGITNWNRGIAYWNRGICYFYLGTNDLAIKDIKTAAVLGVSFANIFLKDKCTDITNCAFLKQYPTPLIESNENKQTSKIIGEDK